MPISTISQIISTIPEAGRRGVDVQTQFVIKQEDFQDHLQGTTVSELNTLKTQINTTVTGMNTAVDTVNTKASEASASASSASTSANTAATKASEASASASSASASSTKAGQWADANYNVQVETGKYSAKHWATEAQNVVANKIDKVTSTDNAIVRFNGITGEVQNSSATIDDFGYIYGTSFMSKNVDTDLGFQFYDNGSFGLIRQRNNRSIDIYTNNIRQITITTSGDLLLTSGTGGIGYGTGAGGTVTQLTSRTTGVTLSKPVGNVTLFSTTTAAGQTSVFTVTNTVVTATDIVVPIHVSGGNLGQYIFNTTAASGSFTVSCHTPTAQATAAPVIKFIVIKGVIS